MSAEIAEIRGIPAGVDCASPSRHAVFHDVDSMLDFVELVADETGLPVGIKSAVGNMDFWDELVAAMAAASGGVDFVNIDGGEGGTGAAPMVFADTVAYPFRVGFSQVYKRFAEAGLTDDVTFIGAGKLGIPENAWSPSRSACDMVNVGREAMLVDRLHPGPEVPHRPLPGRRRHPEPALHPRPRPDAQERAGSPTTSRRCAATCSRSPRPSASSTPR